MGTTELSVTRLAGGSRPRAGGGAGDAFDPHPAVFVLERGENPNQRFDGIGRHPAVGPRVHQHRRPAQAQEQHALGGGEGPDLVAGPESSP